MSATTDAVDASLSGLLATIIAKQAEYLAEHGEFFQALPTSTGIPRDGVPVTPDNLEAIPARQTLCALDLMPSLAGMELYSRGQIHRMGSGESAKYAVIAEVLESTEGDDIHWLRRITCNAAGPVQDSGWLALP